MARLKRLPREMLNAEQREFFDAVVGGDRLGSASIVPRVGNDGALEGPFNARLLNPAIGQAMLTLAAAVLHRTTLSARLRELVILTVASELGSSYEQYAHEKSARSAGISDTEIAALAACDAPSSADSEELAAIGVARLLLEHSDLSDIQYGDAVTRLGERKLFEIIALVGMYSQTALQLRVFRVVAPLDKPSPDSTTSS